VFGLNAYTFTNWISQPLHYSKWVAFVTGFTFADVVNAIPQQHREKYGSVLLGSQVQLPERFSNIRQGTHFVSAAGVISWQKTRRASNNNKGFVYITKSAKTIGSGRKAKYPEEEEGRDSSNASSVHL
jgi:hypothetical protein